jgi:hypothetical protein
MAINVLIALCMKRLLIVFRSWSVRMNVIPFYGFLFFIFLGYGCVSVKTFNIEVLRPAGISVPPHLRTLVVLSNVGSKKDSVIVKVLSGSDSLGIRLAPLHNFDKFVISRLKGELDNRRFFDSVKYANVADGEIDSVILHHGQPGFYNYLSEKYQADAALLLDKAMVDPVINVDPLGEGAYFIIMQQKGALLWNLYDVLDQGLVDRYLQVDTMYWSTINYGLKFPVPGLPGVSEASENLADHLGLFYADRLAPYWEQVPRYYYTGRNSYFILAEDKVRTSNWEEAGKIWFQLYKMSSGLIKARAAHNIALSMEMKGDFEQAGEWAQESYFLYQKLDVPDELEREKTFYTDIAKRYVELRKLKIQLGDGN